MKEENINQSTLSQFGMIGLGTMGRNLLLNIADKGFTVAGYDKNPQQVQVLENEGEGKAVRGFDQLDEFIENLTVPRIVMLLVPAGKIVDAVIHDLLPLLDQGDLIIDGGNSKFTDTDVRSLKLQQQGIHFFGMGISGGEEGARHGPSMMPGGNEAAYRHVQPILEKIAARVDGEPCVVYIGPGSSGHFVKMVHNGIEYALMQLIAETYQLMKVGLLMSGPSMHQIFANWNKGRLQSFLIEITRDILAYREPGAEHLLLEDIKDEAKSKGTGKWTSQFAMDLQLAIPSIDVAVSMRDLSKYKSLRLQLAEDFKEFLPEPLPFSDLHSYLTKLEEAFYFSFITIYAQGMHLLSTASKEYQYHLNLGEIAKIWRGGCIIRSAFLEEIYAAFQRNENLAHLFLDKNINSLLTTTFPSATSIVTEGMATGHAIPVFSASLNYFNAIRTADMPTNLIQAQRDYFGAHTYELKGKEGVFHTNWTESKNSAS